MKLKDKVAIVTGGGTGIGAAITKRLVSEGAKVCITGRREDKLKETIASLPKGSVISSQGDVTQQADIQKTINVALSINGRIDVLINNAAYDATGSLTEITFEEWQKTFDTNLSAPFLMMKAVVPLMSEKGGGSIINISSLAGLRCMPRSVSYCSSKAGLIMLTKQVALEYGPQNIRCNVVCPGATRTSMIEETVGILANEMGENIEEVFDRFSSHVPLRRISKPSEMGGVCVFLASDDSSFMTGAVLVMDGGAAVVDVSGASIS